MDDRLSRVESNVRHLETSLRTLEQRVALIEGALSTAGQTGPASSAPHPGPLTEEATSLRRLPGPDVVTILSFVGRAFVVLGGAYLLRALTDSAVLAPQTGIALGLGYAAFWLVMADRAAATDRPVSAAFHGLVTVIIAFPLVWEAVTRFKLLGAGSAAMTTTLVTALTLGVAVRRRLQVLAWIAILTALPTMIALAATTGVVLPFAIAAVGLGIATLWIGYSADWVFLRWPVAFVADAMVLALAEPLPKGGWADRPAHIIAIQLLLLTGYLASIVSRTLVRGRDVNAFEVLQAVAALAIGFGGAVYVAQATGFGTTLAAINLAFGGACYGVAFAFVARRQGLRRNFYFYTSLALVLVLVSTQLLLQGGAVALTWTTLGVLTSWLAGRTGRITLNLHAAVYVIAAASVSGLLASATSALVGSVNASWGSFSTIPFLVLAGVLICWLIPMSPTAESWDAYSRLPRLLIAMVLVWSAGGWMVGVLARGLVTSDAGAVAGAVATVRTGVLAATTLALAWAGRHDRFRESAWLLYPMLAAGGLKLLLEDLPRSRPATLFVALALYGGALIGAPRLARRV